MINKLVRLSEKLDSIGCVQLADHVDSLIYKLATDFSDQPDAPTPKWSVKDKVGGFFHEYSTDQIEGYGVLFNAFGEAVVKALLQTRAERKDNNFFIEAMKDRPNKDALIEALNLMHYQYVEYDSRSYGSGYTQDEGLDPGKELREIKRKDKWERASEEIEMGKRRRLKYRFSSTLDSFRKFMGKEDATKQDVKDVQQKLLDAGFTVNSRYKDRGGNELPDGLYGAVTENAADRLLYDMGVYNEFYEAIGEGKAPDMLVPEDLDRRKETPSISRFDIILSGYAGKTHDVGGLDPAGLQGAGMSPDRRFKDSVFEDEDDEDYGVESGRAKTLLDEWKEKVGYDLDDGMAQALTDSRRTSGLKLPLHKKIKLNSLYRRVRRGEEGDSLAKEIMALEREGASGSSTIQDMYDNWPDLSSDIPIMGSHPKNGLKKTASLRMNKLSEIYTDSLGGGIKIKR